MVLDVIEKWSQLSDKAWEVAEMGSKIKHKQLQRTFIIWHQRLLRERSDLGPISSWKSDMEVKDAKGRDS